MSRKAIFIFFLITALTYSMKTMSAEPDEFITRAPASSYHDREIRLRTNLLPWLITVPNAGAEFCFSRHWSALLDVWFCPWILSQKFSVKTAAILPEARWWVGSYRKGSFFNIHLDIAWFNVRWNDRRYQDSGRPLLGVGIGYGYRIEFNPHWGMEFEIGAGIANMRYDRFYNVKNGALIDTRQSTYFGIDRAAVTLTYYIGDL